VLAYLIPLFFSVEFHSNLCLGNSSYKMEFVGSAGGPESMAC